MTIDPQHPRQRSRRLGRIAVMLAAALGLWALLLAASGGIRYDAGPFVVSSRNPLRPALLAILLAALGWRLGHREWLAFAVGRVTSAGAAVAPILVAVAAAVVLALGVAYGVRAAGGADPLGYVSESDLWLQGRLHVDQGVAPTMPWPHPQEALAPLGYRPSHETQTMVPTYAPGLPLLMAGARILSRCGPYYIGPVAAAALVVFTYLLGRRFFSRAAALIAALLTATSPTIFYMSLAPMADVPAATFWIGALLAASRRSTGGAAAAGVLAGVAIAIRPNLVPLALFPWLSTLVGAGGFRTRAIRTLVFAAAILPFVGLVAAVNEALYGSPLRSGYGALSPGFMAAHGPRNLLLYPQWWLESQGPLAFLFVASVLRPSSYRRPEVAILIGFSAVLFLSYLFYIPFDVWWFLRFLIPAMPIAFLLSTDAVEAFARRFSGNVRIAALIAFTLVSLLHVVHFTRSHPLLESGEGEQKYVDAGVFIERATPTEAVIISMQHSGSIRYYSGRLTLRYDALHPEWLDRAIEALERSGRPVYILIDDWEEAVLRRKFAGQRALANVDRGPAATGRGRTLLFYTVNRAPYDPASPRIPRTSRFECRPSAPGFITAGQAR